MREQGTQEGTPRLLCISQAAERLGVSRRTVQAWIAAGRLRILRLSPRVVRIDPAELARFLSEAAR